MKYLKNGPWPTVGNLTAASRPARRTLIALAMIVTMLTLMTHSTPASAANCLKDEYGKNVQCTANDVKIASASNVRGLDGTPITSCQSGSTFSFIADFTVATTATQRENIGLYFATAGQASALTGTCSDNIIAPQHSLNAACTGIKAPYDCCTGTGTGSCVDIGEPTSGSPSYEELDPAPDDCGDISTADNNQVITVLVQNVLCQAAPGGTELILPNCTSWQQPGGTSLCDSAAPDYPYPAPPAAVPGAPSKCNCNSTFVIPITVQSASINVTKTPNPSVLSDPGGSVTYTVAIQNTSNFGNVTINQICDNQYGNIATAQGSPCTGPLVDTGTTCKLPQTIAANGSYSCTFTGNVAEPGLSDTVTVNGVAGNGTTPLSGSASASVTVNEAESTAAVIKTAASASPTYGCATVRYNVAVDNTSAMGSDETQTLTALMDSQYGNIAALQGNVLGTTCGVATTSPGLGTLSGSSGAGALAATIDVGGSYSCQFDAKVCGNTMALSTSNSPPNATNCPAGIETMDTVTGTIVGDDSPPEVVTQTPGTLTVDVCFATSYATQTP